jgi:predicted RNA-binding Zn-ribbon protein involved in translation (DUF1610 family)
MTGLSQDLALIYTSEDLRTRQKNESSGILCVTGSQMALVEAMSQYCPACGREIHPSEIPVGLRNSFACPSCGEWLMYDTSNFPIIGAVSFVVAIFGAWSFGYRSTRFVLIVFTATLLLWIIGALLIGILIPVQIKRYRRIVWFTYDNRYSPAIWAISFTVANVIAFSFGYYKESLNQDAMFFFVVLCITYLLGFLGNFLLGVLIPHPPNQAKGEPFNSAGSLHLSDKSEVDKKPKP